MEVQWSSRRLGISGPFRQQFYTIVTAGSGDTLTVGMRNVLKVNIDDLSAGSPKLFSVAAGTVDGTSVITFNGGGDNFVVEVIGN